MTCENENDILNELSGDVCYEVEVICTQVFTIKAKDVENVEEIIEQAVENALDNGDLEVTSRDGYDSVNILNRTESDDYIDLEVEDDYYDN